MNIYIGDDSENYQNNQLCPGGPFLDVNDPKNYSVDGHEGNTENKKPWNYGVESWCNLEGRFLHLIFDLNHYAGEFFNQALCNLGVFGTRFLRSIELPSHVEVIVG